MPDAKRKGQKREDTPEKVLSQPGETLVRHGVQVLEHTNVDSYQVSKLCLALREAAKLQGLKGSITVRLDGRACR